MNKKECERERFFNVSRLRCRESEIFSKSKVQRIFRRAHSSLHPVTFLLLRSTGRHLASNERLATTRRSVEALGRPFEADADLRPPNASYGTLSEPYIGKAFN